MQKVKRKKEQMVAHRAAMEAKIEALRAEFVATALKDQTQIDQAEASETQLDEDRQTMALSRQTKGAVQA